LTQAGLPSGLTVNYHYDGLGRRIQRTTSAGANQRYVYDGRDVLIDLNSDWSVATTYLNDLGIDNHLRQTSSTSGVAYFVADHLGSTRALTDDSGNVLEQLNYDSFGNSTGSNYTRYTYTGREFDSDTGLDYYRARFYDPQIGRFISEDPAGFRGSSNWYSYVANEPTNSTDPMGLWETRAHNYILDEAFKNCLSKVQIEKLKEASADVDGPVGQLEGNAYQHGMRGGSGQSEAEARRLAAKYISDHEKSARSFESDGCKIGYENINLWAISEIGHALHTIMDETSPAHEGFQVWHGPPYPTGIVALDAVNYTRWYRNVLAPHEAKETLDVLQHDNARFQLVKKLVREEFEKTFGECGCCTD
jgi:RHS repeat-associated protein